MRYSSRKWAFHRCRRHVPVEARNHGIHRSTTGAALVQYVTLLGLIACALFAGVFFSRDLDTLVYQRLAGELAETKNSGLSAAERITDAPSTAEVLGGAEVRRGEGPSEPTATRLAGVLLVTAVLAALLWQARRLRHRRAGTEEADEDASAKRDEDRLRVKRQVLWQSILDDPRLLLKNRVEVRHLMTRNVSVVAKRTQSAEIRRMMDEKNMHHVLVVDSEGRLLGVVSDRDLRSDSVAPAAEIMSREPIAVRPDTAAHTAIAAMLEHQISCLPVVENDRLCGILTRTDLLLSLQCMLQWWLRFAQTFARAADCSDKIDAVQAASGRYLGEQRTRLHSLTRLAAEGAPSGDDWDAFEQEAKAFLDTSAELIAMQTFEGDRLSEMARDMLEITKS